MKKMKRTLAIVLALVMVLGVMPLSSFAADTTTIGHMTTKPADSTTENEPFPQGTGGSNSFRIPALVTLSDGTLVAAADARWNTTYDGGGLDTIVSISTDNGANWSYSFANYMGDNGNTYSGNSTCFIDPSLAVTANDTIYMLVDLYPSGVALNGSKETDPVTTKGFNDAGYLLLTDDGYNATGRSYDHYLKDGKIYTSTGEEVNNYTVDAYFNVFKGGTYHSNLFFDDCDYTVVRTGFLYLTKGTYDKTTKTIEWSAPTLLNLKTNTEMVCLVGPGRGLVNSKGTIIFPVYSYNGESAKYTGLIYSEDNGATWSRTDNLGTAYTSEATLVELGNGNLRVFVRNENSQLTYYDYTLNGNSLYGGSWGSEVKTGVKCNSDTELSAIVYSKTVDGNPVVLVSAPAGPNAAGSDNNNGAYRSSGKIFMGLINDDYTMTWKSSSVAVTNVATSAFSGSTYTAEQGFFAYSCLTEQDNGSVSILYEDSQQGWGSGTGYGYTMAFKTYTEDNLETAFGVTFDAATTPDEDEDGSEEDGTITVRIPVGGTSKTYVDESGNYEGDTNTRIEDRTVAEMTVKGTTSAGTTVTVMSTLSAGDSFYLQVSEGVYLKADGVSTTTNIDEAELWKASYYTTITTNDGSKYLYDDWYGNSGVRTSTGYTKFSNGQIVGYYNGTYFGVPVQVSVGEETASTSVSFKGLKAGTTTAIVGTTQYNITVYEDVDVKINYTSGGKVVATGTVKVPSDAATTDTVSLPGTVTDGTDTYKVDVDTLTLSNGIGATYTVPVTLLEGVSATVTVKGSTVLTLDYTLTDGQYVVWTTADGSYVSVAGNYDSTGAATNKGTIIGNKVTPENGEVQVIGTVYNKNGTVAHTGKYLVTVTEGTASTNSTNKYIYIDIVKIENCTVYYSINGGELIEITDDMLVLNEDGKSYKLKVPLMDEQYTGGFQISVFAAPDEGYALVEMSSSNSDKQYYTMSNGNPDGVGSEAWPFADDYDYDDFDSLTTKPAGGDTSVFKNVGVKWGLVEGNLTVAQLKVMYANAFALGCDGVLFFTKNANGTANGSTTNFSDYDLVTEMTFIATKLPTVDKTLNGVLPVSRLETDYRPYRGTQMVAAVGEYVYFNVTITLDLPTAWIQENDENTNKSALKFTAAKITDQLTGAYFYTKELDQKDPNGKLDGVIDNTANQLTEQDIADLLNADWTDEEKTAGKRVIELFVVYPITAKDLDTTIVNNATLDYKYTSQYSSGVKDELGQAIADIHVVGAYMNDIVIDFGLPVSIVDTNGNFAFAEADRFECQYGEVAITEKDGKSVLTYTPTEILQNEDLVVLYDKDGKSINSFYVIPATSVYYEEGFLLNKDYSGWASNSATIDNQKSEELGKHENNFGFDGAYAGMGTDTGYIIGGAGATTTFTFTGTGFQLFGNSSSNSGVVAVRSLGGLNKLYLIDTKLTDVDGNAIEGTYHGLPFISETDLPYGTYTVTIKQTGANSIYLDGIRVFNTINDTTEGEGNIYYADKEDRPDFYEIRDFVLKALGVEGLADSQYTDPADRVGLADSISQMAGQVYNAIAAGEASAVIVADSTKYDTDNLQKLLDNGPKNELYLYAGQTLVFNVKTNRVVQLGLKSPTGAAEFTITVDGTDLALNSLSTSVDMFYELAANSDDEDRVVTVSIKVTSGVLSATLLKICDDPNATFPALTQEDIENAMLAMYGLNEVKADANLTVDLKDYTGKVLGSVELSANGVEGQTAVFTAAEILAAAKAQLPAKYAFVDESAVADVEVVYGQSEHTSVQIGKVATLKIKYVSMFGKTKGTATITVVQTARGYCRITASEIKAAAPAVRRVLWTMPVYLPYGNTVSIVVPVM